MIYSKKKVYIYLVFISVSGTQPLKSLEFPERERDQGVFEFTLMRLLLEIP